MNTTHVGSCHCGNIRFEVEGEIDSALACNCSICQRKGSLLWFVPASSFRLLNANAEVSAYTFNKRAIRHCFCPKCGMHPFGEGKDGEGNEMRAINLRCLEGIDLETIPVNHFDGRSL